jgi:DNA-binding transcriptional regulator LsrR (DeoR family)
VSRILAAARDQGVVEIRIHAPGLISRVPHLEEALRKQFGIEWATVVARPRTVGPVDVVAEAAARVFEDRVAHLEWFGMSWGLTVDRFVDHVVLEPIHTSLKICPMVGGLPSDTGPAGNTSLELLANRSGATSFRFESPAVVESRQTWAALATESSITSAVDRAAHVQLAFVGIGSFGQHSSRRVVAAMHLSQAELALLASQAPAGDICGRYFDIHGSPLGLPTSERVIGITMQELAAVPEVWGLAGGVEKAPGVVGALRTGTLNGIVLDEELARSVLNLAG